MLLVILAIIIILVLVILTYLSQSTDPGLSAKAETPSYLNQKHQSLTNINNTADKIGYPVLYINLDSNPDRRKFVEDQFSQCGIQYERIPAVYGKDYNLQGDHLNETTSFLNSYELSASELGCTLSHLKAIKYAYDSGRNAVVIMEDDVCLALMPLWTKSIPEIVQTLPTDWRILQLYHHCDYPDVPEIRSFNEKNCYGTVAYLINRNGMKAILDNCFHDNTFYIRDYVSGNADDFIYYTCASGIYICSIPLFYTYNGNEQMESQIHPTHTPEHISTAERIIDSYLKRYKQYAIFMWTGSDQCFTEIAQLFREHLMLNNCLCDIIDNFAYNPYDRIIVFGANLCKFTDIALPNNVIIVNMEQLYKGSPWLSRKYIDLLTRSEVWDYNANNINWLKYHLKKDAKLFRLGYAKCLEMHYSGHQDIDVLFYGWLNPRRQQVFNELKAKGLNVIFREDLWDDEKHDLISRAKIILNIHSYPTYLFESARVIPLLINRRFVISENSSNMAESDYLKDGLVISEYDQIVDKVLYYLNNSEQRDNIAKRGYQIIQTIPTVLPLT